jgi:hypothetical protein
VSSAGATSSLIWASDNCPCSLPTLTPSQTPAEG